MNKLLLLPLIAIVFLSGCVGQQNQPAANTTFGNEVSFQTTDGFTIFGNYMPAEKNSSGVILLHMLNRNRDDWAGLAQELNKNGYAVLAIDSRGHGKSTQKNGQTVTWQQFSDQDFNAMTNDVVAAKKYLIGQGVNPDRIGIVGASVGANIALNYAAEDKNIKTVVLLSPGLDYHGVQTRNAMIDYGSRPIFFVASSEDTASVETVDNLSALQPLGKIDKKTYSGAGHGTSMFSQPDLDELILKWLKENL